MRHRYRAHPLLACVLSAAIAAAQTVPTIDTLAGSSSFGDGGPAVGAILHQARGLAVDIQGNIYIAETAGHRIRKVSRSGIISTYAGTGVAGFSGDGGLALAAEINSPYGLAADVQGNLFIADLGNARVRRVAPDGVITTIAGGGSAPFSDANADPLAVALVAPRNLLADSGALYISDFAGHRVYRLQQNAMSLIAGTGVAGNAGNGGPANAAQLAFPAALALDLKGALLIADSANHVVRKITGGRITDLLIASTPTGLALDVSGGLWVADPGAAAVTLHRNGEIVKAYSALSSEVVRSGVNVFATDDTSAMIWRITAEGANQPIAGGGNPARGDGGAAMLALLQNPTSVAADGLGNFYTADRDNHRIRRVDANGVITTIAAGDLKAPEGVSADGAGNLLIADTGHARVITLTSEGSIRTVLEAPFLVGPSKAIAAPDGNVYIADSSAGKLFRVNTAGVPTVLRTGLLGPRGLALQGNRLYFSEEDGKRVGRLNLASGEMVYIAEGAWKIPRGVSVSADGAVYVADTGRQQIVRVDSVGAITVVAGSGVPGFAGDGASARSARLNFPWDAAVMGTDRLLIADLANHRIRVVKGLTASAGPNPIEPPAPVVGVKVLNAASQLESSLTPGMLATIRSSGLPASARSQLLVLVNSEPAEIVSMDDRDLQILVPASLAASGQASIVLIYEISIAAVFSVQAEVASPGLFDPGFGAAAPAPRGSIISLFGTGLGLGDLPVSAKLGAADLAIVSVDPSPGYPGLFEVKVRIPDTIVPGSWPVKLSVGGAGSQAGVEITIRQ